MIKSATLTASVRPREAELLSLFLANPGRVLTHDLLIRRLFGIEEPGDPCNVLDQHIRRLRIELKAFGWRITNYKRVGYELVEAA